MPVRRPSASLGGFITSNNNPVSSRVHKSSESHHLLSGLTQPHSILHSGGLANPQQKVVQVLINRLKNKVSEAIEVCILRC